MVSPAFVAVSCQTDPPYRVPLPMVTCRPRLTTPPLGKSLGRVRAEAEPFQVQMPFCDVVLCAVRRISSLATSAYPSMVAPGEAMFTLATATAAGEVGTGMARLNRDVPALATSERLLAACRTVTHSSPDGSAPPATSPCPFEEGPASTSPVVAPVPTISAPLLPRLA